MFYIIDLKSLEILLKGLSDFIDGKSRLLKEKHRKNATVFHYYQEIVRNWNKLNFIINKTTRSLKTKVDLDSHLKAHLYYSTYRIFQEKVPIRIIIQELKPSDKLLELLKKLTSFSWSRALEGKSFNESLSLEEAIPTFFIERLTPVFSKEFLIETIKSMNYTPTSLDVSFRINDLRFKNDRNTTCKFIIDDLRKEGIKSHQDKEVPFIYYTKNEFKSKLLSSEWYKKGYIILHDKASFLISQLLLPKSNELICDMCAAPGIKTSIIAQLSNNESKLIACEFNFKRLMQLKKLLKKLAVSNSFLLNVDSTIINNYFHNSFDKILIDAPCTGSGTFLNHPELKWRQNYEFLNQNLLLQSKMIESSLKLLKPGGILVYVTCSLYPEEGENQIKNILDYVDPLDLPHYFSPSYKIDGEPLKGTGRLFPSIHNTQGFFVSKLKKK